MYQFLKKKNKLWFFSKNCVVASCKYLYLIVGNQTCKDDFFKIVSLISSTHKKEFTHF